jgi:hypothetical protein
MWVWLIRIWYTASSCPLITYLLRVQEGNLLNWDDKQALQQQAINMYYKAQLSR